MKVKLISMTQPCDDEGKGALEYGTRGDVVASTAEGLLAYCARVSSPNQDNPEYAKLLKYCFDHKHFSVFSMADMTVEITTSRAISAQILRHKSFDFQEFSQRYAEATEFETYEARRQDVKNRQNSIDDLSDSVKNGFIREQKRIQEECERVYKIALSKGIAKEQARFLLPMSTQTKLYMKGSIRSWIHYCQVRCEKSTQKEHRDIAEACKRILVDNFPAIKGCL